MKIISTAIYRYIATEQGSFDSTDYEIRTVSACLLIVHFDEFPDRWFVNYLTDQCSTLRIVDHMDRSTWRKVWAEFRQIQNRH